MLILTKYSFKEILMIIKMCHVLNKWSPSCGMCHSGKKKKNTTGAQVGWSVSKPLFPTVLEAGSPRSEHQ